jgi:hypothetical protein
LSFTSNHYSFHACLSHLIYQTLHPPLLHQSLTERLLQHVSRTKTFTFFLHYLHSYHLLSPAATTATKKHEQRLTLRGLEKRVTAGLVTTFPKKWNKNLFICHLMLQLPIFSS